MQLLILAAGRGTRLGTKGHHLPKAMMKIHGRTLIERVISQFLDQGIVGINVVVGYRSHMLMEHVISTFPECNVRFIVNDDVFHKDNIYSVWCAREVFGADLIMMDGDLILDDGLVDRIMSSRHENALFLRWGVQPNPNEMNVAVENGRVTRIAKGIIGTETETGESTGIFKLSESAGRLLIRFVEGHVVRDDLKQHYEIPLDKAVAQTNFGYERLQGPLECLEIDTEDDIAFATRHLSQRASNPS